MILGLIQEHLTLRTKLIAGPHAEPPFTPKLRWKSGCSGFENTGPWRKARLCLGDFPGRSGKSTTAIEPGILFDTAPHRSCELPPREIEGSRSALVA